MVPYLRFEPFALLRPPFLAAFFLPPTVFLAAFFLPAPVFFFPATVWPAFFFFPAPPFPLASFTTADLIAPALVKATAVALVAGGNAGVTDARMLTRPECPLSAYDVDVVDPVEKTSAPSLNVELPVCTNTTSDGETIRYSIVAASVGD